MRSSLDGPSLHHGRGCGGRYSGDFKQSHLDEYCYPFDEETLTIEIELMKPGNRVFKLELFCPSGYGTVRTSCELVGGRFCGVFVVCRADEGVSASIKFDK